MARDDRPEIIMTIVLLIRHGENDYVKKGRLACLLPGVHLNEAGRAQAQALADQLKDAPIKAIYSSPLERAVETAKPLAEVLGLEVIVRPGLMETNCGEWQGKTVKSLSRLKSWKILQTNPSLFRFPGGESFQEIQFRFVQEIQSLRAGHEEKDVFACVAHADPIKLALAYYLGLPLDNFQRFIIAPASVSALLLGENGSRLLTMNYHPAFNLPKD